MSITSHTNDSSRSEVLKKIELRYASQGVSPIFRLSRFKWLWKRWAWLLIIRFGQFLKRSIDIVVSLLVLFVLSPIFILVAILIYAHDRGPILFWQSRVGLWGQEFPFPKFRSMVLNAEQVKAQLMSQNQHAEGVTFKMKNDPRITPIGRFIRKLSIDEMPQLWCVVAGNMSLVGPRPPLPQEVRQYSLAQRRRLDIKPGMTCFWQVEGRGDIPFTQQVELDVQYINSQSITLDIVLLLKTIPAVLMGKGAY